MEQIDARRFGQRTTRLFFAKAPLRIVDKYCRTGGRPSSTSDDELTHSSLFPYALGLPIEERCRVAFAHLDTSNAQGA